MKRAVFESDYASGTNLAIVQTDDGDIILKISGSGEMRIATSGGKLHGQNLVACVNGFSKAIDAILGIFEEKTDHSSPKNDPLTLEELREMDGESVYLETGSEILDSHIGDVFVFPRRKKVLPAKEYGKTWLAYRRKPEEGDKNA